MKIDSFLDIKIVLGEVYKITANWTVEDFARHVFLEEYELAPDHRQRYFLSKFNGFMSNPVAYMFSNLDLTRQNNLCTYIMHNIRDI